MSTLSFNNRAVIIMLLGFAAVSANREKEPFYNILAIDGGGIRGLIPAVVLEKLEAWAFEYIQDKPWKNKVPSYPGRDGVVAFKDIFDLLAGTSTGSIISAALAYPIERYADTVPKVERVPKYFMKEVMDIYSTKGDQIFKEQPSVGWGW